MLRLGIRGPCHTEQGFWIDFGEGSSSKISIDVPMMVMCFVSDDGGFTAVDQDCILAGLPVSVSFDIGLVSVSRDGLLALLLDNDCVATTLSEASSPTSLPISTVDYWVMISAVGENRWVIAASNPSSSLAISAGDDSG